jgi:phage pi2 protein 07
MDGLGFWRNSHFRNRSSKEKETIIREILRVPKQEQMISKVDGITHNHNKMKHMHEIIALTQEFML